MYTFSDQRQTQHPMAWLIFHLLCPGTYTSLASAVSHFGNSAIPWDLLMPNQAKLSSKLSKLKCIKISEKPSNYCTPGIWQLAGTLLFCNSYLASVQLREKLAEMEDQDY